MPAGTVASPLTGASQLWKASSDSMCGIAMPYLTCPLVYQPRTCSEAPRVVRYSPSIAASLTGWSTAMSRASQSPIRTCTGAARQAMVSGMARAARS